MTCLEALSATAAIESEHPRAARMCQTLRSCRAGGLTPRRGKLQSPSEHSACQFYSATAMYGPAIQYFIAANHEKLVKTGHGEAGVIGGDSDSGADGKSF